MLRRAFVLTISSLVFGVDKNKKFRFKIRTKNRSIIYTTQEASDVDAAKVKVRKRYPDCEFLSTEEL